MGRGSSGGGGRSSGGASHSPHSSGGRMSSSGRGAMGGSSGRGRQPVHNNHGGPRMPFGGPRIPFGGYYPRGFGRRRYGGGYGGGYGGCGSGCVTVVIILVVLVAILAFSFLNTGMSSNSITASTTERTKLDSKYTTSTEFYVDELGWIRNSSYVNNGLKSFYNSTGVHPLLYITDTVNGKYNPTSEDMEVYSEQLYQELCPDEGHILLLFHCHDGGTDYSMWYTCGSQAKIVMDEEACNILMDYIDAYFVSNKSDDEMFADAFEDAGKRIMSKTVSPIIYVAICAAIIVVIILAFIWWRKYKEQKNLEAKQTADILNTDLETLSNKDAELSDLEDKYSSD